MTIQEKIEKIKQVCKSHRFCVSCPLVSVKDSVHVCFEREDKTKEFYEIINKEK